MVDPLWKQVYATVGINLLSCSFAFNLSLQSIIVPSLRTDDNRIILTEDQESWLSSVAILLMFPSQMITGYLMEKFGRNPLLCLGFIALFTSNITIAFASSYSSLLTGLLIVGSGGGPIAMGAIYTAEYCSPSYRGSLLSSNAPAQCITMLLCHLLGIYLTWKTLAVIGAIPSVLGFIIVLSSPESPVWLASQGKFKECEKSFKWYKEDTANDELEQLIISQKRALARRAQNKDTEKITMNSCVQFVFDKGFIRACAICLACTIFIDGSGKQIFNMLALDIITEIIGSKTNVLYYALVMDICDFTATSFSCYIVKKFKRRTLLFKMALPAILSLLLFCMLSFLNSKNIMPKSLSWLTLSVIMVYFFILSACITPVAFALFAEVCPISHRGLGLAVNGLSFYTFLFIFTKLTPSLLRAYEAHGTFLINFVLISGALISLFYLLPETGDRTLMDIEIEMKGDHGEQSTNDAQFIKV